MSIYETPLQLGYFVGLLFAILLWYRGYKEERLSDTLLGFVMFLLAMEIQDYTFGFAGINVLWEEMNGFPRYFALAFAPTIYLYLKSQINKNFKLSKADFIHYIPYALYFIFNLIIFLQGKEVVDNYYKSDYSFYLGWFERLMIWTSYIFYFYLCLKIYHEYRRWTESQYADTITFSYMWLRNFIYLIIAGEVFKNIWHLIDVVLGDLPFEQDWWWHLLTVFIIFYVGINGYSQRQTSYHISNFEHSDTDHVNSEDESYLNDSVTKDLTIWKQKILDKFDNEKIYLDPDLSLRHLATILKTNSSVISATINQCFEKNFNDFVNEYRIRHYLAEIEKPANQQFTKLAVAFDSGFNSRATFNRALKKFGG